MPDKNFGTILVLSYLPVERTGKELLIASKPFAIENRTLSWWCLWSTVILLAFLLFIASSNQISLIGSLSASVLAGFVMVRLFVIYHDFFHGAILKNSKLAYSILYLFGLVILSPATGWKSTHDHHHKHNSSKFGAEIGGFPLVTTDDYASFSFWNRFGYRVVRSPLIILFGYLTSFLINKTLVKLIRDPRKNYACGIALILHIGLIVLLGMYSVRALLLGMVLPLFIGSALGTYIFYVQHNFPGMKRKEGKEWDYVYAALYSSSFLKLGPIMNWLTGNIGFHHVHHLNAKIPFYRLQEAMDGLVELQSPTTITFGLADMCRCLKLKLWDPASEQLLTFHEARMLIAKSN